MKFSKWLELNEVRRPAKLFGAGEHPLHNKELLPDRLLTRDEDNVVKNTVNFYSSKIESLITPEIVKLYFSAGEIPAQVQGIIEQIRKNLAVGKFSDPKIIQEIEKKLLRKFDDMCTMARHKL